MADLIRHLENPSGFCPGAFFVRGERAFTPAEPKYGGAGGVNWLTFQLGILGFGVKKRLHFSVSLPFSVQFGQKETKFYHY
jgi:hypothetical protein